MKNQNKVIPSPNLNQLHKDFFNHIDSKEKAYWLGFLYADGNVRKDLRQLRISLHIKDLEHLQFFAITLGVNPNKINIRGSLARLWISRVSLCKDLVTWGCFPNKSKTIRFPSLASREFDLAFLLGYYDGDGKSGTTYISSGSQKFLQDIQKKFAIPLKLRTEKRITYHEHRTRSSNSTIYELPLGAPLFNEIMDNYLFSLYRKRKYYDLSQNRWKYRYTERKSSYFKKE